jgi:uncharacterized protein DUF938
MKAARVTNVCAPITLDASHSVWPIASADGIICINMVHISPWEATLGLIKGAAAMLPPASPLYLYGPYKREGFATALSNQAFDRSLRDRDPNWGLRDPEAVAAMAQSVGFSPPAVTEMSANNLSAVFRRMESDPRRATRPRPWLFALPDTCGRPRESQLHLPFPSHRPDVADRPVLVQADALRACRLSDAATANLSSSRRIAGGSKCVSSSRV